MTSSPPADRLAEATSGSIDRELPAVEALYLHEVRDHLRDLPRTDRAALVAVARDHLSERPPAGHDHELLEAVGPPSAYAARLRAEHGLPSHLGPVGRVRRWPRWAKLVLVAAIALVIAGALTYRWWVDQSADIHNSCGGYHPADGLERHEAAGHREVVLPYRDGAELRLAVCLSADRNITIDDVRLPGATYMLLHQTGLEMGPGGPGVVAADAVPFEPFSLDGPRGDPDRSVRPVWVVGRFGDCEWYVEGGGNTYDRVEVDYELLGRRRTATVALSEHVTVLSPSAVACPRQRPEG